MPAILHSCIKTYVLSYCPLQQDPLCSPYLRSCGQLPWVSEHSPDLTGSPSPVFHTCHNMFSSATRQDLYACLTCTVVGDFPGCQRTALCSMPDTLSSATRPPMLALPTCAVVGSCPGCQNTALTRPIHIFIYTCCHLPSPLQQKLMCLHTFCAVVGSCPGCQRTALCFMPDIVLCNKTSVLASPAQLWAAALGVRAQP